MVYREYVLNVPPTAGIQPPNRGTRVVLFDDLGRGSSDNTYTWYVLVYVTPGLGCLLTTMCGCCC